MNMDAELKAFLQERDALFRNLTEETANAWWRNKAYDPPVHPSVPLATAHKARLQWLDVTDAMIEESTKWLEENGYETTSKGAPPLTPEQRDKERIMHGKPPLRTN